METENKQSRDESSSELLSESDVFASADASEMSECDVFVGDEEFYRLIAKSVEAAAEAKVIPAAATSGASPEIGKRFSAVQFLLALGVIVTAGMVAYALLTPHFMATPAQPIAAQSGNNPDTSDVIGNYQLQTAVPLAVSQKEERVALMQPQDAIAEPVSLKLARELYVQGDYDSAHAMYSRLYQNLAFDAEDALMRDFLQLKMALCKKRLNDIETAKQLLTTVSRSRSPVVAAVANYNLALLEVQASHYLRARTKAYQTIALIDSVSFDKDWVMSVQRDCNFLIAQCLTQLVLSLRDGDKDLPPNLWPAPNADSDPLVETDEMQLRSLLASGVELFNRAVLGPRIEKSAGITGTPNKDWCGSCFGASIEELLGKFSANANLDIQWVSRAASGSEESAQACRNRAVTVYIAGANTNQFASTAAGCAGLLAWFDNENLIQIHNPAEYSSLSEHVDLLSREALSLWQRFILAFYSDRRTSNAHFVLGLLHSCTGRLPEAIGEFKLLTSRSTDASLAPYALLHSSRIKKSLKDYFGARQDLKQVIEQYPNTEFVDRACLYLADSTAESGIFEEAAKQYAKVYHMTSTPRLQSASSLGAARCLYNSGQYSDASGWLERCIGVTGDVDDENVHSAFFLLGQSNLALGRPAQACEAFEKALNSKISKEKYIETVTALAKSHIEQANYVEAMEIVETVGSQHLSVKEGVEVLVLKTSILRRIGLAENAVMLLGERANYVSNPELKTMINFELALCHIDLNNLELARQELTDVLAMAEPGPVANKIAMELASVCYHLGNDRQTITLCSQLLATQPGSKIQQQALNLMAKSFDRCKDYDKAALVLLGRWKEAVEGKEYMETSPVVGKIVSQNE